MAMAMEALRVRASYDHHNFPALRDSYSPLLLLPQAHLPFPSSRTTTISCSRTVQKRTTTATSRRCRALPLAHPAAVSSAVAGPESDQRLDLAFSVGSAVIPHPAKAEKGGEDAFFVSNYNGGILGVADGVSGWAEENVDPALFARELMEHAVTAVGNEEIGNCPRQLLAKAHEATSAIGAATAIVAILERKGGILHIANLGDCGLRLIRKGKIVFATSTQQHYFDCPYQLSSEPGAQTSTDAMVYKIEVLEGDIVIMGSDGLFDNVYDKDIENTVSFFGGSDEDFIHRIATALASLASKHAKDVKYESPYSQEAILQGYDLPLWKKIIGQKLTGGKLDDITVLAAHVVHAQTLPRDDAVSSSKEDASLTPMEDTNDKSVPSQLVAS